MLGPILTFYCNNRSRLKKDVVQTCVTVSPLIIEHQFHQFSWNFNVNQKISSKKITWQNDVYIDYEYYYLNSKQPFQMVTCWTKLVVNRYKHLLVFRVWSGWCIMQCICIYIAWRDDILYIGKYLPLFEFSPLSFSLSVVNLRHCKFRTIFKQLCLFKLCIYYCVWAKSRQVKTICIYKGQK